MKQIKRQIGYSIVAVAVMLGMATIPVSADNGGDSTSTTTNSTTGMSSSGSQTDSGGRRSGRLVPVANNPTEDGNQQSGNLRSEAESLLNQDRKNIKEHSEAERQKACQQRQAEIDKHTAQFATEAQKHLDTFNSIFTKLQAFHDSKGLKVTDYTTLVADATAKQTAAQSAVNALKALNVNIDCSQPDPATTVATIKEAVMSARTALQDYRTSLKNLVVALKGASTAQTNTTTGTDNTQSTGGTR